MTIKTLVIGLGKIGMMYDYDDKKSSLSHSQSINKHPHFFLSGAIDLSSAQRKKFFKKFKKPTYIDLKQAIKEKIPDLIIISVGTKEADEIYTQIIKLKICPKAILFEKPVSYYLVNAKKIFNYCKDNNIHIFVNYNRRYDPSTFLLDKKIKNNYIGKIKKIEIFYKKGLYNACSHYINFIQKIFPGEKKIKRKNFIKNIKNDFLFDFILYNKDQQIYFYAKKTKNEFIRMIGDHGKLVYYTELDELFFVNDKNNKKFILKNNYSQGQISVLNNIYKTLNNKSFPLSSSDDAIECLTYLNKINKYYD
tara:strand:- start:1104 stop:2024 length:921 start_codon:yes stop_codon:yes gene_type:complete